MPLTKIQSDILGCLASHRDPEKFRGKANVAGATPLNRAASRFSSDIDVFHDRAERVAQAALNDAATLSAAGFRVDWLPQLPLLYTAGVTAGGQGTPLEWLVDSITGFSPPCAMSYSVTS